jgi:hypothetical protein
LAVREKNGREWVMDGTPQQFGWPRAAWLLAMGEFLDERVGDRSLGWPDDERRKKVRGWVESNGFWAVMQERMELFKELKWNDLVALPRALDLSWHTCGTQIEVKMVKKQAEIKFAGTQGKGEVRFGLSQTR